ncbi:MAG: hypothetical protein HOC71_03155, partial [Candidatus Latescibacteria bacterium]|nr:hypothetical protein [Candidatus Latescibacterota bacterium]
MNSKVLCTFVMTLVLAVFSFNEASSAPGRWEKELSGPGWKLWRDREAEWVDDDIYMPPVDISLLPVNP